MKIDNYAAILKAAEALREEIGEQMANYGDEVPASLLKEIKNTAKITGFVFDGLIDMGHPIYQSEKPKFYEVDINGETYVCHRNAISREFSVSTAPRNQVPVQEVQQEAPVPTPVSQDIPHGPEVSSSDYFDDGMPNIFFDDVPQKPAQQPQSISKPVSPSPAMQYDDTPSDYENAIIHQTEDMMETEPAPQPVSQSASSRGYEDQNTVYDNDPYEDQSYNNGRIPIHTEDTMVFPRNGQMEEPVMEDPVSVREDVAEPVAPVITKAPPLTPMQQKLYPDAFVSENSKREEEFIFDTYRLSVGHQGIAKRPEEMFAMIAPLVPASGDDVNVPIYVVFCHNGRYHIESSGGENGERLVVIKVGDYELLCRGQYKDGLFSSAIMTTGVSATQGDFIKVLACKSHGQGGSGHIRYKYDTQDGTEYTLDVFLVDPEADDYAVMIRDHEFTDNFMISDHDGKNNRAVFHKQEYEVVAYRGKDHVISSEVLKLR